MGNQAKLSAGGKDYEYPVLSGSIGPDVVAEGAVKELAPTLVVAAE